MVKRRTVGLSHFPASCSEGPSCETEGYPGKTKKNVYKMFEEKGS